MTKHILASCLGVLAIYDSVSSISFSDKTVALFFGCAATVFEISVVLCHLWIFTNDMPAREFFYYFVILCKINKFLIPFISFFFSMSKQLFLFFHSCSDLWSSCLDNEDKYGRSYENES